MTFFARAKSGAAIVAHSIDWSSDLGSGATITTSTWDITGGTEDSDGSTATSTTVSIAGGEVMTPITATNTVTTTDGQTLIRTITIPVDAT